MRRSECEEVFTLETIDGLFWEAKKNGRKQKRRAVVNCETLALNLITPIVYGRELEWDLQELHMLGSCIMSST